MAPQSGTVLTGCKRNRLPSVRDFLEQFKSQRFIGRHWADDETFKSISPDAQSMDKSVSDAKFIK